MIVPVTKAFDVNIRAMEIARADVLRRVAAAENRTVSYDELKPAIVSTGK